MPAPSIAQFRSPTMSAGTSPRLRIQGTAHTSNRALSAAAARPSTQPYSCTTCKAWRRPACATTYCKRWRSASVRPSPMGSTRAAAPLRLLAAAAGKAPSGPSAPGAGRTRAIWHRGRWTRQPTAARTPPARTTPARRHPTSPATRHSIAGRSR
eukprot:11227100-Lingulodinium_polyedra.AAC.3